MAMQRSPNILIRRLRAEIETLPRQMQAAAKYIIDHPADFGLDPIRVTAAKTGVSSNVLVRLAHRFGFDGFEAFRHPFRQTLVTDGEDRFNQDWLSGAQGTDTFESAHAGFAQNEMNVVSRSLRLQESEATRRAIDLMNSSKRCFVNATRASYALAYYFYYVGRMANPGLRLIPRHMGSAIDDLFDAGADDCLFAITVHPYSSDTIKAIRYASDRGAHIVLLSDSNVVAPGLNPDVTLTISTRTHHHLTSFSGAMAVIECLLAHLFQAGGSEAQSRVEGYQKAREDSGAYWRASLPPRVRRK